jgi:hypothetical protein
MERPELLPIGKPLQYLLCHQVAPAESNHPPQNWRGAVNGEQTTVLPVVSLELHFPSPYVTPPATGEAVYRLFVQAS